MKNNIEAVPHQDDPKFKSMKQTLQKILDKHLPSDKRFSVENFGKEDVWYMCRLLLEKDDMKRNLIWQELDNMRKNTMREFLMDLSVIEKKKAEMDNYVRVSNELDKLMDDVILDRELDINLVDI